MTASSRHQYSRPEADLRRVAEARHHDPFTVLGRHPYGQQSLVRSFLPFAEEVRLGRDGPLMQRIPQTDFFEWTGDAGSLPAHYRLHWTDKSGQTGSRCDPYSFPPQVSDYDLHLFNEGRHWHVYRVLGAHPWQADGITGSLFAVWAPNAERVSVVGDFNGWDGRVHPMRIRGASGVWELFIPDIASGELYKFEIRNRESGRIYLKSDPYAQQYEAPPRTASIVPAGSTHAWGDHEWLSARRNSDWLHAPMSIYEVHPGSWKRHFDGRNYSYRELAEHLVAHVTQLGYTHIELLPVMEHPFRGSWGYQPIGNFAPSSRFGTADDFRHFVDHCHRNGIGVILDWVPAHFPKDEHGLARFDGTALYEHEDPRRGEHPDWGTLIYNYGRKQVRNYLLSSALYWLEEFHADGLRVDAVASMLYLDYTRKPGEWLPNAHGGRENLDAIEFLRELNAVTHGQHPGTVIIAEESTSWPQVTRPTWVGGLGFSMKWNMGWMHDSLDYLRKDPIHRHFHHDHLTFGMLYNFSENFVLPLSHDEVVHGKGSLVNKMAGDEWQRFANLRLLFAYQATYPGKKLLFMGGEFAQTREWSHDRELDWGLLQFPPHAGIQQLVTDLNRLYRELPALHRHDFEPEGFSWIDCNDAAQSVISFQRRAGEDFVVVILNFTPVPRLKYRIGVPAGGEYRERLNSDSSHYGGSNAGNIGPVRAEPVPCMGQPHSLVLTLPPLAGLILQRAE